MVSRMPTTQRQPQQSVTTEPSSWRPLIAMILSALGVYAALVIVPVLEATAGGAHGLVWLAVPGVLFFPLRRCRRSRR